jgi:hypothetical protein
MKRALFLVVVLALGIFAAESASAQGVPTDPPDTTTVPKEAPSSEPPSGPAPPPPVPPPAPPPAPPPPNAPPVVTLEETPEEPPPLPPATRVRPATKQRAAPHAPASPPQQPSEATPASAGERSEPSPVAKTQESDEPEPKSEKDDGDGLLGPFRIGPVVGFGLPSILSFGGMIKLTRYFGAGLNIGLIPAIKLSLYGQAEISYQEYDIYGRLFPFGGNLFLGAAVGYESVKGTFKSSFDVSALAPDLPKPLTVTSEGFVRTLVLTPTIGLLHTFGSGFTLGIDLGAQIPIAPSTTRFDTAVPRTTPPEVVARYVKPNDKKVQDTLDTVGRTILPTLNLRVGWLL